MAKILPNLLLALKAGALRCSRGGERERLLLACLAKAATKLQASIDRIEVTPDEVLLRAEAKEVAISYKLVSDPNERSKPRTVLLDGEDYWDRSAP